MFRKTFNYLFKNSLVMVGAKLNEMVNNLVFPVGTHALPCHIFRVFSSPQYW